MCDFIKKHICRIVSAAGAAFFLVFVFMAVCFLSFFSVFAAASETVTATIPVSVTVSGGEGTAENYTFRLTALNGAPLPENDTVTICGAGSAEFSIDYYRVGVYQYTVTQEFSAGSGKADEGQDGEVYDDIVYYVTVTVQNTEDGGIGVTVSAHRGSIEGDKCEIRFENIIETETETSTEESSEELTMASAEEPAETSEKLAETSTEAAAEELAEAPTETDTLNTSAETDAPQTGDDTPVAFWFAVMTAGLWLTLWSFLHRTRKKILNP
ncbi:MAG: hypothetical protein LIP12_08485 [Clostridiales bacterium]|nr:hypothetical protein [Clostridiales bacterium]